jgi:uncharacterized repeat protein (TIGR03803 family)
MHSARRLFRYRTIAVALAALAAQAILPAKGATGYTESTLYTFCSQDGCADGGAPNGGLIEDGQGNLFGTAGSFAIDFSGTVFELVPNADKTKWKYKLLHQFCSEPNCADGGSPSGALILDASGNLYGTAYGGGVGNAGVVFRLTPGGKRWKLKVLYDFCPAADSCADGLRPFGGLTYEGAASGARYDGVSPLYGTASAGGANGKGVAYQLLPPAPGKMRWKQKVIYNFCSLSQCADGATPSFALLMDGGGNLYGTTWDGGKGGTAFELSPNSRRTKWTEVVLHRFCQLANCSDGSNAWGTPVMDAAGNLFGVTSIGGDHNEGTIFKIVPNGVNSEESVLYSFCSQAGCADGDRPLSGLALDAYGNLFGVTPYGGANCGDFCGGGVAFELSGGTYSVIHVFCQGDCSDGGNSTAPLIDDSEGNLFGVTLAGTANHQGAVFELKP